MTNHENPAAAFTATLAERTIVVSWPDNERGGAVLPPDNWQERAWEERTLHEIDEGSISGCSVLRWRDDPRTDAELLAVSVALVSGKPAAVSVPPPAPRADDQAAVAAPVKQRADLTETEWAEQDRARFERLYTRESARADKAEARATAMEHAMESTAADALKHRGCHRDLMAQCLRAERAEAEVERLRAMADEAPQPEPESEPTAEEIARANVLALHQIGEQLAGIESWMWEHLADVREGAKAQQPAPGPCVAGEEQNETPEAVEHMLARMRADAAADSFDGLLRIIADWYRSSEGRDVLFKDLIAAGYRLPERAPE